MPPSTARSDSSLCGKVFCCGRVLIMPPHVRKRSWRHSPPPLRRGARHERGIALATPGRSGSVPGIERRRRLVDDLDLVAVGIEAEDIWLAGAERAPAAGGGGGAGAGARRA